MESPNQWQAPSEQRDTVNPIEHSDQSDWRQGLLFPHNQGPENTQGYREHDNFFIDPTADSGLPENAGSDS